MFPFKFEIINLLNQYFDNKYGKNSPKRSNINSDISPILFTIYLSYLNYKDLDSVFKIINEKGYSHYNVTPNQNALEYLQKLPNKVYSKGAFSDDEYSLFENAGILIEKNNDVEEAYEYIKKEINGHPLFGIFYDILKDKNNFLYWYSIASNRVHRILIEQYEVLMGWNFKSQIKGAEHYKLMVELSNSKEKILTIYNFHILNFKLIKIIVIFAFFLSLIYVTTHMY